MAQIDEAGPKEDSPFIRKGYLHLLDRRSFPGMMLRGDGPREPIGMWTNIFYSVEASTNLLASALHGGRFTLGDACKPDTAGWRIKDLFCMSDPETNCRPEAMHLPLSACRDLVNAVRYCVEHTKRITANREKVFLNFSVGANRVFAVSYEYDEHSMALSPVVACPVSESALQQSYIELCNRLRSFGGDVRIHTVVSQHHILIEGAVDSPRYLLQIKSGTIWGCLHVFVGAMWNNLRSILPEVLVVSIRVIPHLTDGYGGLLGIFQGNGGEE